MGFKVFFFPYKIHNSDNETQYLSKSYFGALNKFLIYYFRNGKLPHSKKKLRVLKK